MVEPQGDNETISVDIAELSRNQIQNPEKNREYINYLHNEAQEQGVPHEEAAEIYNAILVNSGEIERALGDINSDRIDENQYRENISNAVADLAEGKDVWSAITENELMSPPVAEEHLLEAPDDESGSYQDLDELYDSVEEQDYQRSQISDLEDLDSKYE